MGAWGSVRANCRKWTGRVAGEDGAPQTQSVWLLQFVAGGDPPGGDAICRVALHLTVRMCSFRHGLPFNHENLLDRIIKLTASVMRGDARLLARSVFPKHG